MEYSNISDIVIKLRGVNVSFDDFLVEDLVPSKFLVGIDTLGRPVLLIKTINPEYKTFSPFNGKNLDYSFNQECSILLEGQFVSETFTIVRLKSNDKLLESIFFRLCLDIVTTIESVRIETVFEFLSKFRKIFSNVIGGGQKEEIGLWGELVFILLSENKKLAVDSWHSDPKDNYDFNTGQIRIEIKTTKRNERIHHFSLSQLEQSCSQGVFICSLMTSKIDLGESVHNLIENILNELDSISRITFIDKVTKSAGQNLENFNSKFDLEMAKLSLRYFDPKEIPSINSNMISSGVANIKFDSNLSRINQVVPEVISSKGFYCG